MKFGKKIASYASSAFMAGVVLAQDTVTLEPPGGFTGLKNITVPQIITGLVQLILIAAAVIAFVFLIIGGIKWITSGGDKAATEAARGTITAALVGLLIVFGAWAIIQLVQTFFGITILGELKIPKLQ